MADPGYNVNCFDAEGKVLETVSLPRDVFDLERIDLALVHQLVVSERNNRRQGSRKVKGRSEVRGGGRKPWRQKGTGNARAGSTRSPIWKGGGVVFGPSVDDNFSVKLSKKIKKAAFRSMLSSRLKTESIQVIRDFKIDSYSTKKVYNVFKEMNLLPYQTVAYVSLDENKELKASFANIPNLTFLSIRRPLYNELYYCSQIVLAHDSLDYLSRYYANKKSALEVSDDKNTKNLEDNFKDIDKGEEE